ncbi:MAG: acyl carrier protein [Planctomycetota bacterium]
MDSPPEVEQLLAAVRRLAKDATPVDTSTPLLSSGLIDSLRLVHLIAEVEKVAGRRIPDRYLNPVHFNSVGAIERLLGKIRGS